MGYYRGGNLISAPKRTHSADIETSVAACGRKMRFGKDSFLIDGSTSLVTCSGCLRKLGLPVKKWDFGKWHITVPEKEYKEAVEKHKGTNTVIHTEDTP